MLFYYVCLCVCVFYRVLHSKCLTAMQSHKIRFVFLQFSSYNLFFFSLDSLWDSQFAAIKVWPVWPGRSKWSVWNLFGEVKRLQHFCSRRSKTKRKPSHLQLEFMQCYPPNSKPIWLDSFNLFDCVECVCACRESVFRSGIAAGTAWSHHCDDRQCSSNVKTIHNLRTRTNPANVNHLLNFKNPLAVRSE